MIQKVIHDPAEQISFQSDYLGSSHQILSANDKSLWETISTNF